MYPASHMRSNKSSRKLPGAGNVTHNTSLYQHPLDDSTVASKDAEPYQGAQDVTWTLPPRNPVHVPNKTPAAARPDIAHQSSSRQYGSLARSKHASPQQSRIPSPTKSIPKGIVSATENESLPSGRFRHAPEASYSRLAHHLSTDSRKQPDGKGHPSEVCTLRPSPLRCVLLTAITFQLGSGRVLLQFIVVYMGQSLHSCSGLHMRYCGACDTVCLHRAGKLCLRKIQRFAGTRIACKKCQGQEGRVCRRLSRVLQPQHTCRSEKATFQATACAKKNVAQDQKTCLGRCH